jgi:hypothetical protein
MARTGASGGYLGGIGTMLSQSDVCPSCGQVHPDRQPGFPFGRVRECPNVMAGVIPAALQTTDFAVAEEEFSVSLFSLESIPPLLPGTAKPTPTGRPVPPPRKPSLLTVPWPMPSTSEEFL